VENANKRIDTILNAARVEVELTQADLKSQFLLRDLQKSFTKAIEEAKSATDVTRVVTGV